jgi:anti-sigma regulatory factor (Ser/Thr protein kinase)
MAPFVHTALFYRGTDEYLAGTVPFVRAALAAAEPVLVAVAEPWIEVLAAALDDHAADVRFLDMRLAGRNPGKIIAWILHPFVEEYAGRRVRIIDEPVWAGRTAAEYPACVQHEALVNLAFAGREATVLCTYDAKRLPPGALADAAATHPVLVDLDIHAPSPSYTDPDAVVAAYNQPLPEPVADPAALDFAGPDLAPVRQFVSGQARRAGLARRRVGDLQTAANELATNAVAHGGGGGEVRVWRDAGQVVCEVRDRGRATGRLAGRVLPPPDSVSGRGLVLVNYLCDLVRIHTAPHGTAVRLYLDLGDR